jgi:hypothetical protein
MYRYNVRSIYVASSGISHLLSCPRVVSLQQREGSRAGRSQVREGFSPWFVNGTGLTGGSSAFPLVKPKPEVRNVYLFAFGEIHNIDACRWKKWPLLSSSFCGRRKIASLAGKIPGIFPLARWQNPWLFVGIHSGWEVLQSIVVLCSIQCRLSSDDLRERF